MTTPSELPTAEAAPTGGVIPMWRVGDRLSRALEEGNVSKQAMADYLGVSRNTIGNYIHGRAAANQRTLMLWAQRTGVSFDWLSHGDTPPPDAPSPVTSR